MLQSNLDQLDFSFLLPDVMTIADEVDSRLTQSMNSYMEAMRSLNSPFARASLLSRLSLDGFLL